MTDEAGFEAKQGMSAARMPSVLYNERTNLMARAFLMYAVGGVTEGNELIPSGLESLEDIVRWLYVSVEGPRLLHRAVSEGQRIITKSESLNANGEEQRDGVQSMSKGACISLRRLIEKMATLDQSTENFS